MVRPAPTADVVQKLRSFRHAAAFHSWLEKNHARRGELLLRCAKVGTAGLTYREALDEALCFGWIDGVRRSLDARSFSVRFTPRREKSQWSSVNVRRAQELIDEGRMRPAGLAAFRRRETSASSLQARARRLPPVYLQRLQRDPQAWYFYLAQPPWYRRTTAVWILSGKRRETRNRRFAELLSSCAAGRRIGASERKTSLDLTKPRARAILG